VRLTAPAWQPLRHNADQPAALIVGRTQITKTLPIGGVFLWLMALALWLCGYRLAMIGLCSCLRCRLCQKISQLRIVQRRRAQKFQKLNACFGGQ
jgi:hypothetical protein